ncbi:condensation domain-containing protein [Kitasatospora aburaviensis]
MTPVTGTGDLPVSFGQERLVFLDRLEGPGPAYTIPVAWRLTGPLDRARLAAAFDRVVARHEPLRTRFTVADGAVRQHVDPGWPGVDWRGDVPAGELARAVREAADEPFDLAAGPVLRVTLWRLAEEEHVVLVALHHIAADGWSTGVLVRELEAFYAGGTLPEPPVRYADFAAWQRRTAAAGDRRSGRPDRWRRRLAGLPPLELPTDGPRPAGRSTAGAVREFTLAPELVAGLEGLGRRHGATLFMTLLAGFEVLLSRWSGQSDFAVGTPVAGRSRPEVEQLIGFFVNTSVLRADLSGDPSFGEVLHRVRADALDAYEDQDVPFERIVDALAPDRELHRTPLFQAMFSLDEDADDRPVRLAGLTGTRYDLDLDAVKFDLVLQAARRPEGVVAAFFHRADLWSPETARRWAEQYTHLLEQALAHPDTPLSALELLPEEERRRLAAWAAPSARTTAATCSTGASSGTRRRGRTPSRWSPAASGSTMRP